jgi:hypothetical protein
VAWGNNDVLKGYQGMRETGRPVNLLYPFGGISASVNKERGFLMLKILPYFIKGSIEELNMDEYMSSLEASAKAFNKSYSKYLEY